MSSTLELEPASCPLGCSRDSEKVLTARDRLHGLPGEFTLVRCRACGTLRTDPRPTPASIGLYYPKEYGPYLGTRVEPRVDTRPPWRRAVSRLLARISDTNADRMPAIAPGRMLEVGCASGSFLRRMALEGWDVEGIEFSETAAQEARSLGYRVHTGALETAPPPCAPYDLVVGWMVLEHLHDPVRSLLKLRSWTRPGSWLVISVPNAASLEFALFRDAWYSLDLPRHLWIPTPSSLARVLDRGGWRLERIFYHRDVRSLVASLGCRLEDSGRCQRLAQAMKGLPEAASRLPLLLHPLATALAFLRQASRMTAWGKRADD